MITEKHIIDMYVHLRETNQSIPDEALEFMKRTCLSKLSEINSASYSKEECQEAYPNEETEELFRIVDVSRGEYLDNSFSIKL